ncbi:hypothetical protein JK364_53610 [Streptomyces sp. 110]|uniref:Uncharacterized protein n=1 Tax=Streptomyces endocoffeicus TaxID=2898945 RepID=A0ABS1Q8K5_9ACTN|nr:hypothetical protein [Streptomyces endocoffeicus]MBL1121011.1 hypothetical protein [Streptomyces endocoffeicus]
MLDKHPSDAELRSTFAVLLDSVCSGSGMYTHSGLDTETEEALWSIARAYPDVPDSSVAAARAAFAGQLDGSNVAAEKAEIARKVAEFNRKKRHGRAN